MSDDNWENNFGIKNVPKLVEYMHNNLSGDLTSMYEKLEFYSYMIDKLNLREKLPNFTTNQLEKSLTYFFKGKVTNGLVDLVGVYSAKKYKKLAKSRRDRRNVVGGKASVISREMVGWDVKDERLPFNSVELINGLALLPEVEISNRSDSVPSLDLLLDVNNFYFGHLGLRTKSGIKRAKIIGGVKGACGISDAMVAFEYFNSAVDKGYNLFNEAYGDLGYPLSNKYLRFENEI